MQLFTVQHLLMTVLEQYSHLRMAKGNWLAYSDLKHFAKMPSVVGTPPDLLADHQRGSCYGVLAAPRPLRGCAHVRARLDGEMKIVRVSLPKRAEACRSDRSRKTEPE